jgi:DNA invertase Pin-like site-specific DNA recombinase
VILVDDDLGRTASGTERPGFESLLTAVCIGVAGAVFSIEDSRLARNGREWQTLLEFCGLVNCLIIDENTVYDPRIANDRLLLGIKGVFSELELSVIRQRSQEALRLKAASAPSAHQSAMGALDLSRGRRFRPVLQKTPFGDLPDLEAHVAIVSHEAIEIGFAQHE